MKLSNHSLRRRVMVLLLFVIVIMASLDLVAAHWSLRRSLATYSSHSQLDQVGDWAQLIALLYDENQSWPKVESHLKVESSLQIDGKRLGQITAVVIPLKGPAVRTQPDAKVEANWRVAPIMLHGHKLGTLYLQGYVPPKIANLKNQIIYRFDLAQFLVVFFTSVVAFVLTLWLIRSFLSPLEQLAASASAIIVGDYEAELPEHGDVEIQNVVKAFSVVRNRLNEARQAREKILSDIHHELRTPMTIIANRLEAIHLGLFKWDEQTANTLHVETERMKRIVDELEQLNNVHDGVQKLECGWVVVQEWLSGVVAFFAADASSGNITLRLVVPDEPLRIWIDKNRMSQVMINLIANALRFTPAGKGIYILAESTNTGTILSVSDEGVGISPEHLPFIFERFYRVDSSRNRDTGGAGLGLAIVKEVVHAHDGEVFVFSRRGEGTRFKIVLSNG